MDLLCNMAHLRFIVLGLLVLVLVLCANGFNISPKPNVVLREPDLKIFMDKKRSSYFGYSLNLRTNSVIVGAPRAQSSLELQRKVDEPGAIYKCNVLNGNCVPFVFDKVGNTNSEFNDYTYDSEKKDNQWLGATMDGGSKETDRLVVCAPRLLANLGSEYLVHGICYWTPNTIGDTPLEVKKIAPLRLKSKQVKVDGDKKYFYYMFGEQGLSCHLTENNEEILMGAPGIHTWKGSLVRYRAKAIEDIPGFSRRDADEGRPRIAKRETQTELVNEVPNPQTWDQPNDSYFGYSITSGFFQGPNTAKLYYVASAPQAADQSGEVYIFDIIALPYGEFTIKKYHTFHGQQFGEYFGYALLADDFNGDGFVDLAISAPLHRGHKGYDGGAVYIFLNKGNFVFTLQRILTIETENPARFGTTLSKLGDVNKDGYNDIAIGAPFEGDGAVFIYLGSAQGISEKPSQVLDAPPQNVTMAMFGHGLSKGADIDYNQYNDLAIGAPNAELVYVYRTYPVVKVVAVAESLSREIKPDQNKIQIKACWRLESGTRVNRDHQIKFQLKVDPQFKRVQLTSAGQNSVDFEAAAGVEQKCRFFDGTVKFSDAEVFKPIDIELHYDLVSKIPDSETFCETCVALDPTDGKFTSSKIVFSTGCKEQVCVADLRLSSTGLKKTFTLGSSKTMTVTYDIRNAGETAYLPQINITTSNRAHFAKIPSICRLDDAVLLCNLHKGRPMAQGNKDTLTVLIDATNFVGKSMTIRAAVYSTGKELIPSDNIVEDVVTFAEMSEIEVTGRAITPMINLEKGLYVAEMVNTFEIRNNGPSTIKEMKIVISIPISYVMPKTQTRIPLVEASNITIKGSYNDKDLDVVLTQNNTILIQNTVEVTSTPPAIVDNVKDLDPGHISYNLERDYGYTFDEDHTDRMMTRRRRDAKSEIPNEAFGQVGRKQRSSAIADDLAGTLPVNRTIFFNCEDPEETLCIEAALTIYNFQPGNKFVNITTKYHLELDLVDKILSETRDIFVLTMSAEIMKIGDEQGSTMHIKRTLPHNIVSKHQIYSTPIWVIVVSVLGGLLLLALAAYLLYRFGFFRRQKKEELQKLKRESQKVNVDETTDDEG